MVMILRKFKENGVLLVHMTNLGASFKKAREAKGISLDQIAGKTRISTRFLAAIENEEFHRLPGGIFNRGFVRAFAENVGLDPDQAVAEYERLVRVAEPAEASLPPKGAAPARIERHLYPVAAGALVLLVAIFYVVTRDSGNSVDTAPPVAAPAAVSEPAPALVQPAPETAAAAPEVETPPPPAAAPAEVLALEIEATETTWIRVTTDGKAGISGEILEPGMTRKFSAQTAIDIVIGNAAGLTLKINGMRLKPLGRSGQVRGLTITPGNLKDWVL